MAESDAVRKVIEVELAKAGTCNTHIDATTLAYYGTEVLQRCAYAMQNVAKQMALAFGDEQDATDGN